MATTYFKITVKNVPINLEDEVTHLSFSCGALGVSESLQFMQPNLVYEPKVITQKKVNLDVYFEERPGCQFFDGLLDKDKQIEWFIQEEETKDWLEEWKKGFKSFKLVDSFWIIPSWEKIPEGPIKPIFIDPGMAFGTGTHATTQMAASLLNRLSKSIEPETKSVIDIGTGTGILGILASFLKFNSVLGLEIDNEALRVAEENIIKNEIQNFQVSGTLIEDIRSKYDIVIANIIDGVLIKLKHDLKKLLKPSSHLLLSGILKEHEAEFIYEFIEPLNLSIQQRLEKDDWIAFWVTNA